MGQGYSIDTNAIIDFLEAIPPSLIADTAHLLSARANRKHLMDSIDLLNLGKGKAIITANLWK